MGKRVLILGGTQYVGKELINLLHAKGHSVTVAARGNFPFPLSSNINAIKFDRYDIDSFPKEFQSRWDIVIDQLSFYGEEAKIVVEYFKQFATRFILTSSSAVYDSSNDCIEGCFAPGEYNYLESEGWESTEVVHGGSLYQNGKRAAEAYYIQNSEYCSIVRFPQIFGINDLSNRLLELILINKNKKNVYVDSKDKKHSLIHSRDAARFLSWLVDNDHNGPINACSNGIETTKGLVEKLGGDEKLIIENSKEILSIFKGKEVVLNADLAGRKGFIFEENDIWIDEVNRLWNYYINYIENFNSN